ncbi:MAG: hypothetical protein JW958_00565, partial [Candidatus Eisenbacteria bacterium]|nr:hypothetical protein [Candidatus Eisenbacteria bacterium]
LSESGACRPLGGFVIATEFPQGCDLARLFLTHLERLGPPSRPFSSKDHAVRPGKRRRGWRERVRVL